MTFRDSERSRLVELRDGIFKDPGSGPFREKPREFVLSDPILNLWEGIRQDAIEYFKDNQIQWWADEGEEPTGHLLSSLIACVNHLYFLRQRPDLATAVLRAIDPDVTEAVVVDDGYVEFEFIEYSLLQAFVAHGDFLSMRAGTRFLSRGSYPASARRDRGTGALTHKARLWLEFAPYF